MLSGLWLVTGLLKLFIVHSINVSKTTCFGRVAVQRETKVQILKTLCGIE